MSSTKSNNNTVKVNVALDTSAVSYLLFKKNGDKLRKYKKDEVEDACKVILKMKADDFVSGKDIAKVLTDLADGSKDILANRSKVVKKDELVALVRALAKFTIDGKKTTYVIEDPKDNSGRSSGKKSSGRSSGSKKKEENIWVTNAKDIYDLFKSKKMTDSDVKQLADMWQVSKPKSKDMQEWRNDIAFAIRVEACKTIAQEGVDNVEIEVLQCLAIYYNTVKTLLDETKRKRLVEMIQFGADDSALIYNSKRDCCGTGTSYDFPYSNAIIDEFAEEANKTLAKGDKISLAGSRRTGIETKEKLDALQKAGKIPKYKPAPLPWTKEGLAAINHTIKSPLIKGRKSRADSDDEDDEDRTPRSAKRTSAKRDKTPSPKRASSPPSARRGNGSSGKSIKIKEPELTEGEKLRLLAKKKRVTIPKDADDATVERIMFPVIIKYHLAEVGDIDSTNSGDDALEAILLEAPVLKSVAKGKTLEDKLNELTWEANRLEFTQNGIEAGVSKSFIKDVLDGKVLEVKTQKDADNVMAIFALEPSGSGKKKATPKQVTGFLRALDQEAGDVLSSYTTFAQVKGGTARDVNLERFLKEGPVDDDASASSSTSSSKSSGSPKGKDKVVATKPKNSDSSSRSSSRSNTPSKSDDDLGIQSDDLNGLLSASASRSGSRSNSRSNTPAKKGPSPPKAPSPARKSPSPAKAPSPPRVSPPKGSPAKKVVRANDLRNLSDAVTELDLTQSVTVSNGTTTIRYDCVKSDGMNFEMAMTVVNGPSISGLRSKLTKSTDVTEDMRILLQNGFEIQQGRGKTPRRSTPV